MYTDLQSPDEPSNADLAADNQVSRRIDRHPVRSGFVQTTFSYKRAGGVGNDQ